MQIKNIKIRDFRNIKEINISANSGMNVICGENAQGKTNIIEAIWLFTGAKSFKGGKENSFIRFGEKRALTEIEYFSSGILNNAKMEFAEKRAAYLNDKKLLAPSLLAGNFNAVVFSPSDLSIVIDGPDKRRRFLDISIGQLYPSYIEILRKYTRAVLQRNQIIKDYRYDSSLCVMLDVFEEEIALNGQKIIEKRKEFLNEINKYIPKIYSGLSGGKEQITSKYKNNENCLITKQILEESRKKDMFIGTTSKGPHRDDIEFEINGISARNYGSQGQKRSVALSLKLAGAQVSYDVTGEYPVCLLDDVMSELDVTRQNYILNHIKDWQSFITCCDPSTVERLKEGKIIEIKNGGVV